MFCIQKLQESIFINVGLKYSIPTVEAAGQILLSSAVHIMRIIDEKLVGITGE